MMKHWNYFFVKENAENTISFAVMGQVKPGIMKAEVGEAGREGER